MNLKFNPFHLVQVSPWPLLSSWGAFSLVISGLCFINKQNNLFILLALCFMLTISFQWWKSIHKEASLQGHHSNPVISGMKTGMVLFIASEVFFFVSFFWAFFHSSISPTVEMGQFWPPLLVNPFNSMGMPLLNTILLLSSGVTVTWSHHEILKGNFNKAKQSLFFTILLGFLFSILQGFEYSEASFSISDSSFGTTFFMATGFHGLHVIIGSIFLFISLMRMNLIINTKTHLLGFECAAWYWHFVDVVWLFLYSMIYWWGA